MLGSLGRGTLVRGLHALNREEGASVAEGSSLQGAFDEHAGACAFGFAELVHLRGLVLADAGPGTDPEARDPFDSELNVAARRTPDGFELRLSTR